MNRDSIRKLRLHLVEELKEYKGKPVKLDLPIDVLEEILFDHHKGKNDDNWKDFALELNNDYLPCDILRKIDFTGVSFKDFRCIGLGPGYTGIVINPQEVYRKNLSRAKLDGIIFELDERGFNDVHFFETNFKGARLKDGSLVKINPQTIDGKSLEKCILTDVVFDGSFDEATILEADFSGSYNAIMDPQTIYGKSFEGTNLRNVTFINSFESANIERASFEGSINAVINPQKIYNKSLFGTKLRDAYLIAENMDDVKLKNTSFAGIKGNVFINPQTIYNKSMIGCNLAGIIFTGPLDKCRLMGTDFTGSIGGYFDAEQAFIDSHTILANVNISKLQKENDEVNKIKTLIKNTIHG